MNNRLTKFHEGIETTLAFVSQAGDPKSRISYATFLAAAKDGWTQEQLRNGTNLFGAPFSDSGTVLSILCWSVPLGFINVAFFILNMFEIQLQVLSKKRIGSQVICPVL